MSSGCGGPGSRQGRFARYATLLRNFSANAAISGSRSNGSRELGRLHRRLPRCLHLFVRASGESHSDRNRIVRATRKIKIEIRTEVTRRGARIYALALALITTERVAQIWALAL